MDNPGVFWNEAYAGETFVFGLEPNDFLADCALTLTPGRVLSLGEGEGRNGVWLAERGFDVHGVDLSAVGVDKAKRLAAERGVEAQFRVGDLAELTLVPDAWDVIVSVFAHTPRPIRAHVHREVVRGLRPGGHYIFEAYSPAQLGRGTGGPQQLEMLAALEDVEAELGSVELLVAQEIEREVSEGDRHTGMASVTQLLARKPR